ncbi:hypothetical protein ITP53_43545 [Nonomuraea sp. K274]|uniref:Uncharacterized protein n=1 Tax=Nonomuraea cypriaca TaxID=1187855 RepID=A0A931AK45_9ACTN|nr:hypothetical protein [Nonomuraea cypriaca]MBF8192444.1 hypothetical protein [Nonomuraea cypriaca]
MTSHNIPNEIPAERVKPGVAIQRVNLYRDGVFVRQVRYPGTERQARAYAQLQITHDTDPYWHYLLRVLRGEA